MHWIERVGLLWVPTAASPPVELLAPADCRHAAAAGVSAQQQAQCEYGGCDGGDRRCEDGMRLRASKSSLPKLDRNSNSVITCCFLFLQHSATLGLGSTFFTYVHITAATL